MIHSCCGGMIISSNKACEKRLKQVHNVFDFDYVYLRKDFFFLIYILLFHVVSQKYIFIKNKLEGRLVGQFSQLI